MVKALLLSVLVSLVVVGISGARDANGRRGLRRVIVFFLSFNLAYLVAL